MKGKRGKVWGKEGMWIETVFVRENEKRRERERERTLFSKYY